LKKVSITYLVESFLAWARDALQPGTVLAYEHQLRKLTRKCGRRDARRLQPADITGWARTWHELQAVVRLFNWAVSEAGLLEENRFRSLKLPARDERQRVLTPRQMTELLRAADGAGREYLLALRETFARPQEIRMARWDDLRTEDPEDVIEDALVDGRCLIVLREYKDRRRRKESNRPRILLVNARLGRLIVRLMHRRRPGQHHIFCNSLGKPWTNNGVRCLIRRLRERLAIRPDRFGEQVVAYTFRHSVATLASARGIKDRTLADLLGHIETRTTARYQHLDVSHLREALDRLKGERRPTRRKAG
jgi:site-specific recombinase XerD